MGQPLEIVFTELEQCYGRLSQVMGNPAAEPGQIIELVAEAAALFARLPEQMQAAEHSEQRRQLAKLADQLQQTITVTMTEKNKLHQAILELKIGKQAISSYRPPAVGLGYSEGKFLDQKK
jgi:hypothetical protein